MRPLADLLRQADDPPGAAGQLCELCLGGVEAGALVAQVQALVADRPLVRSVLTHAGVLDAAGRLSARAAVLFGHAAALLESDTHAGFEVVLTVPSFLRPALASYLAERGEIARPLETARAVREAAASAGPRLQIAAPFLHSGFVGLLAPDVSRVLAGGGSVQVVTRGLRPGTAEFSPANAEAVALLREAAGAAAGQLEVLSWEEPGLGVHFKVVLAHRGEGDCVAYIGSSNLTPGGTLAHAEAGVFAHGPQVLLLARWLDLTAAELARRRLPSGL